MTDTPESVAKRIREALSYNPETGEFRNLISRSPTCRAGTVAGSRNNHGYLLIRIDNKKYSAHRLAWLYVNGTWPSGHLDHINGQRDDNRIINLRLATHAQNGANSKVSRNNACGFKGVYLGGGLQRPWVAAIKIKGKKKSLGYFATREEAHSAYMQAAEEYFGEFARSA